MRAWDAEGPIGSLNVTFIVPQVKRPATYVDVFKNWISVVLIVIWGLDALSTNHSTSSIDTEYEQKIQYALDQITSNRTSVIIAHRLSTIQKADKIIVLDQGQIVEIGNHQELLNLNGHYKKLFELQFQKAVN